VEDSSNRLVEPMGGVIGSDLSLSNRSSRSLSTLVRFEDIEFGMLSLDSRLLSAAAVLRNANPGSLGNCLDEGSSLLVSTPPRPVSPRVQFASESGGKGLCSLLVIDKRRCSLPLGSSIVGSPDCLAEGGLCDATLSRLNRFVDRRVIEKPRRSAAASKGLMRVYSSREF
jgi:hypothetical protein